MTRAVVLGGGMAGVLAAVALSRSADAVTIVDSDYYPDTPAPRRGLPQGHHNHMFMRGGVEALESLLPGITGELQAAGAKRRSLPSGNLTRSGEGWFRRQPSSAYVLLCSRDLTDHVVRGRALANERITVLQGTRVTGLTGSAERVTGVRIQPAGEDEQTLDADLVVDATGRRSKAPDWLAALGVPAVYEEVVDGGFAYASRVFEAPPGLREDFPGVLIQAQAGTGKPGRGAALLPNEGRRWIVTLFGTRGAVPPTDEEGFVEFARATRHPVIAELIDKARPVSEIRPYRGMANRRRYYEKLPVPEGFLATGDSLMAPNPNYGTGMSQAARQAVALRETLRRHRGLRPGLSRKAQKALAKIAVAPWMAATTQDHFFPDVQSNAKRRPSPSQQRLNERITKVAAENGRVAEAVFNAAALSGSPLAIFAPANLLALLRGPRLPQLTAAQAIAQFPEFGDILDAPAQEIDHAVSGN
ncbi:FAD-dependent monooxygenase [Streptomyces sp. NPDC005485]|uniref:FAD-dependent oxidoreductase n=1 Tax=Streptomyces sp. NPDC005485 TaxID=3155591 RepID=UPI0033B1FF37